MRFSAQRPGRSRRGLTLLEMLVTVALLLLIMTIVVQIFQSATGAMSASRAYQELDQGLRRLDSTIRQDLKGVTARMTPPNDPKDNRGYFEYGENAFADNQGEDTDDYVRFTTKAPEGQPFTGRVWLPPLANQAIQPTLVTSQYAEVIYFLRNGNLYRRVLLVAPERQSSISPGATPAITFSPTSGLFSGLTVSWQGMNDLSARPPAVPPAIVGTTPPVLNTLGDLTNRENRAFHPRFFNDSDGDGQPDDLNGDAVHDLYPTLYPGVFAAGLINEISGPSRGTNNYNLLPFPYVFPGAYSKPDPASVGSVQGWVHSLDPSATPTFNHAPLELGDSLAVPGTGGEQTLWVFPTWRETMDADWTDPTPRTPGTQSLGLQPFDPQTVPPVGSPNFLPNTALYVNVPTPLQPFSDGAGSSSFLVDTNAIWEDDLIMTGVRSFDIKAYDDSFPGYVDLGWGDDPRNYTPYGTPPSPLPFLTATPTPLQWPPPAGNPTYITVSRTYAHEGRIPPLVADLRTDAQFPNPTFTPQFPAFPLYTGNIGDDQLGVIRLRRVWDSWSTDYTRAPASGIHPTERRPTGSPSEPPVYPSYPPPYPMPLRGIQIQIRVVDPRNERIKTLTIRQDFSDKL